MSPEDIRLNYFFHEPLDIILKTTEYLHYSAEGDIYISLVKDDDKEPDEESHLNAFHAPKVVANRINFDKNRIIKDQEMLVLEGNDENFRWDY